MNCLIEHRQILEDMFQKQLMFNFLHLLEKHLSICWHDDPASYARSIQLSIMDKEISRVNIDHNGIVDGLVNEKEALDKIPKYFFMEVVNTLLIKKGWQPINILMLENNK